MIMLGLRQIRRRDEVRLRLFRRLREARTSKCFHHGRDDDENFQDVFFFFGISRDERIEYCAKMSIGGTDSTRWELTRMACRCSLVRLPGVCSMCTGYPSQKRKLTTIVLFVMLTEV